MTSPPRHRHFASGLVLDASQALLAVERAALVFFMGWLLFLILLNVVTRYSGMPIYWVDEAAVYSVVWLTFIGASTMTRLRMDFAVSLLTERLPAHLQRAAAIVSTALVLAFGVAMVVLCWIWMDPVGIARHGFDAKAFAGETFNFLYTERTQTLEWPVWALQLVLPIFGVTFSVHALANLLEELGLEDRRKHPQFDLASADAVN